MLINEELRLTNKVFSAMTSLRSYLVISTMMYKPFGLIVEPPAIEETISTDQVLY